MPLFSTLKFDINLPCGVLLCRIVDDEGSEHGGLTSSGEGDDDDDGQNLLTTAPDLGEVVFVREDPVRLARELL